MKTHIVLHIESKSASATRAGAQQINLQKLPHLSLTFSSSFQSLLPRPHSGNHEQHSGETGDDEDSGGFGKSHRKWQPVRGGTPAHLSARVAGAVHTREACPLSTAHAGHLVAGICPLPHQTQVRSFSKSIEPEKKFNGFKPHSEKLKLWHRLTKHNQGLWELWMVFCKKDKFCYV